MIETAQAPTETTTEMTSSVDQKMPYESFKAEGSHDASEEKNVATDMPSLVASASKNLSDQFDGFKDRMDAFSSMLPQDTIVDGCESINKSIPKVGFGFCGAMQPLDDFVQMVRSSIPRQQESREAEVTPVRSEEEDDGRLGLDIFKDDTFDRESAVRAMERLEKISRANDLNEVSRLEIETAAKLKADAEERARLEEEIRAKIRAEIEEEIRAKAEEEGKSKTEQETMINGEEDAKVKAEEEAKAKAKAEAKAKARAEAAERAKAKKEKAKAKARALAEKKAATKAKAKADAAAKQAAKAKAKAEAEAKTAEKSEQKVVPKAKALEQAKKTVAGLKKKLTKTIAEETEKLQEETKLVEMKLEVPEEPEVQKVQREMQPEIEVTEAKAAEEPHKETEEEKEESAPQEKEEEKKEPAQPEAIEKKADIVEEAGQEEVEVKSVVRDVAVRDAIEDDDKSMLSFSDLGRLNEKARMLLFKKPEPKPEETFVELQEMNQRATSIIGKIWKKSE